ncbi:DUF1304 family protein [Gemella sp. zg-1178]|uniref:DUF1304 family protein n=1 Tax=Gemella sp. zg-1178 TaxID=2840372 RepID=UPI001C04D874|nr:DUF1304 family protein [Gemella sp. zg-1178]MBU0278604.1 DUF1304 family protein [Gemella sp. zg-1178]
MNLLITILSILTGLEFLYIMYLETIATTSKTTSRVFEMSKEELERKSVNTLFKNQGLYNGLLGLLIITATILGDLRWQILLLVYVVLVAAYGALTSNPKILLKQGGLAILALIIIAINII